LGLKGLDRDGRISVVGAFLQAFDECCGGAFAGGVAVELVAGQAGGAAGVDLVDVHVALEQLAVPDVDGLRDHVGVRVLRHARVDQAGQVLAVDVLLDGAAGAADGDRVLRLRVGRDEVGDVYISISSLS